MTSHIYLHRKHISIYDDITWFNYNKITDCIQWLHSILWWPRKKVSILYNKNNILYQFSIFIAFISTYFHCSVRVQWWKNKVFGHLEHLWCTVLYCVKILLRVSQEFQCVQTHFALLTIKYADLHWGLCTNRRSWHTTISLELQFKWLNN